MRKLAPNKLRNILFFKVCLTYKKQWWKFDLNPEIFQILKDPYLSSIKIKNYIAFEVNKQAVLSLSQHDLLLAKLNAADKIADS